VPVPGHGLLKEKENAQLFAPSTTVTPLPLRNIVLQTPQIACIINLSK
jgi:hypothetical protein